MSERDLVLLFVDVLNRTQGDREPILISDLQALIREAARAGIDVGNLSSVTPTMLFHYLRQLVEDELARRSYDGYVVTDDGRTRANELRAGAAASIGGVEQAAELAYARVA